MPDLSATQVLDELITELGSGTGPRERVIDEYVGSILTGTGRPEPNRVIHERADAAVQELRKTWGPTADSHWVDDIVPGRGSQTDALEFDCFFALFHRNGFWGYVRMRMPETDTPERAYLRLILGVVRDTT
jgi:hypothetical protein